MMAFDSFFLLYPQVIRLLLLLFPLSPIPSFDLISQDASASLHCGASSCRITIPIPIFPPPGPLHDKYEVGFHPFSIQLTSTTSFSKSSYIFSPMNRFVYVKPSSRPKPSMDLYPQLSLSNLGRDAPVPEPQEIIAMFLSLSHSFPPPIADANKFLQVLPPRSWLGNP